MNFWLCLVFLFLVVLAFHGKIVPFNNEFLYLLRLEPNFLPNDWSFSRAANEHWLFNLIFSIPVRLISLEAVGWIGRITFWILCLAALLRLGERWEIPFWATAVSISLWLAFDQTVINREWIFGTFEAKAVASACLLFALNEFSRRKIMLPSVLLGLTFSFHPAVGLWAIPAVGCALIAERIPVRDLIKVVSLTFCFSLFGLIPLIFEQTGAGAASLDDWQFIVTMLLPFHLDAFGFPGIKLAVLAAMLAFNLVALWKNKNFALRFLLNFQIVLAGFFVLGIIFRTFEFYSLLRFAPMRLFPVLTPLFFLFTYFYWVTRLGSKKLMIAVSLIVVLTLAPLNPVATGIGLLRETKESWTLPPDTTEVAWRWIAENVPGEAVVIAAPVDRRYWYLARHAQIVSFDYVRYDRLSEWRSRIGDITNNAKIASHETSRDTLSEGFNGLSAPQIVEIQREYSADYLLSRSDYGFPVIFETGGLKVYHLPDRSQTYGN